MFEEYDEDLKEQVAKAVEIDRLTHTILGNQWHQSEVGAVKSTAALLVLLVPVIERQTAVLERLAAAIENSQP